MEEIVEELFNKLQINTQKNVGGVSGLAAREIVDKLPEEFLKKLSKSLKPSQRNGILSAVTIT